MLIKLTLIALACLCQPPAQAQNLRRTLGKFEEVFAWKQVTFNINGYQVLQDRFGDIEESEGRQKRQAGNVVFNDRDEVERDWDQQSSERRPWRQSTRRPNSFESPQPTRRPSTTSRPNGNQPTRRPITSTTVRPSDEAGRFFIQYNNLPMGVERVGDRLFITLPRRRYGVPSTLNYLDLTQDSNTRSPPLRPYPDLQQGRNLTSVYRTRADECNRLWMVDTGLLEIPDNRQQVQPPAIVAFDLRTNRQILRYPFKSADIPAANTPTGLASITIEIPNGDCRNAYAYVPDLATYGLIVYSLAENDSWRLSHNYFNYNPLAGNLNIAGLRFQWNDGIFSLTLTQPGPDGCRLAYFHSMVGVHEFSVSTCTLRNRTASSDGEFWVQFSVVGDRGSASQSTMHGYHSPTSTVLFADIARDGVSCWNTGRPLTSTSVALLARDSRRLSYPSDLHVTGDEVWIMANSLPTWAYSRLDTNEYNFFVYRANIQNLIANTVCDSNSQTDLRMNNLDEETTTN